MKVSKVVLIVVALHVLVIGGIVVFEGCSRSKTSTTDMAGNEPSDMPSATNSLASSMPNPSGPGALAPNSVAGNETMAPTAPAAVATPVSTSAAHTYVVKKGDSLWKISKAENISVGELSRANNLTKTSTLKVGQKLTVPVMAKAEKTNIATASVVPTSADAATVSPTAPAVTAEADAGSYTVKSGDSLWKIARLQNVSVAAIKQANNLTSDSLKVGQKLHVPAATATAKAANDMTANTVSGGIAPTSSTAWQAPGTYQENGQTVHIVDFNESPATIAKKYGIKTDDLLKANNIADARKVQYGQKLVIPQQQATTTAAAVTPATTPAAPAAPVTASAAPVTAAPVVAASHTTVQ
jgi:peptidoglycan endopeptidase LytF